MSSTMDSLSHTFMNGRMSNIKEEHEECVERFMKGGTAVLADYVPLPSDLEQSGPLVQGPGAKKDSSSISGLLGSVHKLTSDQQDSVKRAKAYAMQQSIKMVVMKQNQAYQQQQMANMKTQVQRQQALALMCRVYVGSISFELKEDTIRQAFIPFGPIKSINMSWDPATQKHKGFAFVEYDLPEAAQLALDQMNGVMIGGRNIKVGRPSNMPQAISVINEITEEAKHYNRIYIASIHPDLSEHDIKTVFEAFGTIKMCSLAASTTPGKHKGYGFIEYDTHQHAMEAISSMNLLDLGGQYLRVGKAITPPNELMFPPTTQTAMPTAAAVAAAAATARIQVIDALTGGIKSSSPSSVIPTPGLTISAPTVAIAPPGLAIPQLGPTPVLQAPTIVPTISVAQSTMVTATEFETKPVVAISQPAISVSLPVSSMAPTSVVYPSLQTSAATVASPHEILLKAQEEAKQKQQEELQKKLLENEEPQTLQQQEDMSIKGQNQRHLVMQKLMRTSEPCVVILRNVVGPEDVDETLEEEMKEECSKYGTVERVIFYKEKQSEEADAEEIVKIFVEFSSGNEAETARGALGGRYFGGRLVRAEIYDQTLYEHNDLSG